MTRPMTAPMTIQIPTPIQFSIARDPAGEMWRGANLPKGGGGEQPVRGGCISPLEGSAVLLLATHAALQLGQDLVVVDFFARRGRVEIDVQV